jgi:phospholipid/cholesterol/gamma-HCH transport system substrate-binding protein
MKRTTELQAGIFVAVALALFFLSVFTLGRERQLFSRQEDFFVSFGDVKGLSEGAPVRMGGIKVGRVEQIGFSKELSDPKVHVTMRINEDYLDRIREDSLVSIETQGLLGDRFLSVSTGASPTKLFAGATLKAHEAGDISEVLGKAGEVVDNAAEISEHINEFLAEFREESVSDLKGSLKSLSKIVKEIETGKGLVHRLIYSGKDGQDILDALSDASNDLKDIFHQIQNGNGLLHALIYDRRGKKTVTALTSASENLAETAKNISAIADEIINGEGLLHDMVYTKSPEGIEEIVTSLNATATNLKEASEALAKGEGTIGALLVDSQLYDNLVEVTDGAKRSIILRHAIRSSLEESKEKS